MQRKILFVEPFQQGYGDLIFQTPLFKTIKKEGKELDLLINRDHLVIVKNNPYIDRIFFRDSIRDVAKIFFRKYDSLFILVRDTLTETLIALVKIRSNPLLMDGDLTFWNNIFNKNHTLAWQEIYKRNISKSANFDAPEIYMDTNISKRPKKEVCLIAGVENQGKKLKNLDKLIASLSAEQDFDLTLIGKDSQWQEKGKSTKDLVNQLTYEDTLKYILGTSLVIGPEGSLTHASTTLKIPTIVIENLERPFWKYSNLLRNELVVILNESTTEHEILFQSKKMLVTV